MNANTAMKIRLAIEQAVECGEYEFEIRETFERVLKQTLAARFERVQMAAAVRRSVERTPVEQFESKIGTRCECGAPWDPESQGYACAK